MKKEIKIEGMHCSHCSARVEKALAAMDGVTCVVSLKDGTATVECNAPAVIADDILRGRIEDLGFDVAGIKKL